MHTPLASWIRKGQVLVYDIIRSGITIYAPHVPYPCTIDMQLIRNTCEIVALEMFHQTISAILLHICSFLRMLYERSGIAGQWNRGLRCVTAQNIEPQHISYCSKIKDFKQISYNTYGTRKQNMVLMKEILCPRVAHVQPYKLCPCTTQSNYHIALCTQQMIEKSFYSFYIQSSR